MEVWKSLKPLLVFGFSFSPLWGMDNNTVPKKVFQIPIEIKQEIFFQKPKEKYPKKFILKEDIEINAQKIGLVYPKEVFIPKENISAQQKGFFSCGEPSDKELYTQAVESFNKGKLREAEIKFLQILQKYPNSPYTLKAKYYLGVIAFKEGNYAKAYKIFKELCSSPYKFEWKKFSCYNAVIAGLYIGKHDFKAAKSNPLWEHYLLWLENKESDETFFGNLHCKGLEEPYRNYCLYLKAFINPSYSGIVLPRYYTHSLELRKALLSILSGSKINPKVVEKFIKDPKYGSDFEYFYIYYLISWGDYKKAIYYLRDLYKKKPLKAEKLAKLLISINPHLGPEVIAAVNTPTVWETYLKALYNKGYYRYVLQYAPQLELYRLAAYAAYAIGDYKEVVKYLKKIENRTKEDEKIYLDSLLRLEKWKEFLSELYKIKEKYPELYKDFLGWYYYYQKNWAAAATLLNNPIYKASAYFNLGAYQKAISLLENLNTPKALLIKAKAYMALGNLEKASQLLSEIHTPEAFYLRGLILFAEGRYSEAASTFEQIFSYRDRYPQVIIRLADSYYNLGDYEKAKYYYLLYLKENPKGENAVDAYIGLINVYLATGDPSIVDYILKAIEKYPNLVSEGVKLKLAQALLQNGEKKKAQKLLEELLKSNDPYIKGEAYLLLAELEAQHKQDYLEKALSVGTPQIKSKAVIKLAEYYLSKDDKIHAERVLEKYGKYITDMKELVNLYLRLKDFRKLYYLLQELIVADNSYTKIAFNIAEKYHRVEFYRLAIYSLDPKIAAKAIYRLENIYLKKGKIRQALKYALLLKVRGLKIEPIYSKAMFKIVEALYEEGYSQDACKLIKEINERYLSTEQKLKLETMKVNCSK